MTQLKTPNGDPWHKELVWIHTKKGFVTLLLINIGIFSLFNFKTYLANFISYGVFRLDAKLQKSTILLNSPSLQNCTSFPNSSEFCKNVTLAAAIRSAQSAEALELRARVYDFIVYTLFMSASLWLLASVYRTRYEKTYFKALLHNCLVSFDLIKTLNKSKSEYLEFNTNNLYEFTDKFVPKEDYGLHMFLKEHLVFGNNRKFYELRESIEEVMLRPYTVQPYFLFIHVIEWIHDLLKAVKIMHKSNVYHLNLQPNKIYLHWLQTKFKTEYQAWIGHQDKFKYLKYVIKTIFEYDKYEYSDKRHVVLADFDHACRSENGEVLVSNVGVPNRYRPPECFSFEVVNAAKVDAWCIGVIAYELLTGGMLTIRANRYPSHSTCEEIISDTLNKEFISTAMHAKYHLLNCFLDIRFMQKTFKSYDLDQTVFATDCWTFVAGLLKSSPTERMSVQQALRHPLMKRVQKQPGKIYYINYPL